MNLLLLFILALIALTSYARGHIFSFKERYKDWHPKLFPNGTKPTNWNLSRQTNHDRYKLVQRVRLTTIFAFLVALLLCLESMSTISRELYFVALPVATLLPKRIGKYCGKPICDKKVNRECKRCKIDVPEL